MKIKVLIFTVAHVLIINSLAQAQIREDSSLSTEVSTENERDFNINGGEQRGNNLFHSFTEFSIPTNGSVLFNNAVTIKNIISRVTGSSQSNLNGLIQSNGTANLFLINPNGIIFGKNTRLNIGGSLIATTAENLVFEDGTEFNTDLDNGSPLLSVSVPLGLQFGSSPGEITNQANFSVANPADPTGQDQIKLGLTTVPGATIALLGGNITFDGGAVTSAIGNIELGSVAANSFVDLENVAAGWKVNYDRVSQFQDIKLDNLALIDSSGEGSGNINLRGKNIYLLNGSAITANTLGAMDGGTINVRATDLIEINGSDVTEIKLDPLLLNFEIFLPFSSQISSNTLGAGKGGDVEIVTQDLKLIDGGSIELQTLPGSTKRSGNFSINASGLILLKGTRPLLRIGENAEAFFDSFISLDEAIEINQASEIGIVSISSADGGHIDINAKNIRLKDGAVIAASPFGSGNAGNINIQASESIEVIGISPRTGAIGSAITANTFAEGNAGDIDLDTDKLTVMEGGLIISTTNNLGDAGNINIDASSIEINGFRASDGVSSLISAQTENGGEGGDISIDTDSLAIRDRASLSVRGTGTSVPGDLIVNANSIELNNRGSITAATEFQSGGNITLKIDDDLTLSNNSLISTQAINNANGGNLNLEVGFLIANPNENNDILATAVGGNGGKININGDGIFGIQERKSRPPNFTNDLDASSEFGTDGTVSLAIPNFQEFQSLLARSSDFVDVNYLLQNNFCALSRNSEYHVTGKKGIAFTVDDDLPVDDSWTDWRFFDSDLPETAAQIPTAVVTNNTKRKITMIQGWKRDRQGRVILTAEASVITPHQPASPNYNCSGK